MAGANSHVKPGKFEVPPNYHLEEIGDKVEPWLEDLEDDDIEIWIMQTPPNVDLSQLQGQSMSLEGPTYFDCEGVFGNKLESIVMPNTNKTGLQCNLIAPSKEDRKFHVVKKPFAGHIMLTESFEIPECHAAEDKVDVRSDCPKEPKQRFFPFGSYVVERKVAPLLPKKKPSKEKKSKSPKNVKIEFSSSDAEIASHHLETSTSKNSILDVNEKVPKAEKQDNSLCVEDESTLSQYSLPGDTEMPVAPRVQKKKKKRKDLDKLSSSMKGNDSEKQMSRSSIAVESSSDPDIDQQDLAIGDHERNGYSGMMSKSQMADDFPFKVPESSSKVAVHHRMNNSTFDESGFSTQSGKSFDDRILKKKKKKKRKDSFHLEHEGMFGSTDEGQGSEKNEKHAFRAMISSDTASEVEQCAPGPSSHLVLNHTVHGESKKSQKHRLKSVPDALVQKVDEDKEHKSKSLRRDRLELSSDIVQSTSTGGSSETNDEIPAKKHKKKKSYQELPTPRKETKKKSKKCIAQCAGSSDDTEAYPEDTEEDMFQTRLKKLKQEPMSPISHRLLTTAERSASGLNEVVRDSKKNIESREKKSGSKMAGQKFKDSVISSTASSDTEDFSREREIQKQSRIVQETMSLSSDGLSRSSKKKKKKNKEYQDEIVSKKWEGSLRNDTYENNFLALEPHTSLHESASNALETKMKKKKIKIKQEPLSPEKSTSWSSFSCGNESHVSTMNSSIKQEKSDTDYGNSFGASSSPYSIDDKSKILTEVVQAMRYDFPKEFVKKSKSPKKDKWKKMVKREPSP